MKNVLYLFALVMVSCSNPNTHGSSEKKSGDQQQAETEEQIVSSFPKDICWTGKLNGTTPVFIHYTLEDELLVGEIVYLNSGNRTPIKIIGELMDKDYRILEFSDDGNITGIITGTPTGKSFSGEWFSPKSRKTLKMELTKNDSIIRSVPFTAKPGTAFGRYHYQYSMDGYTGDFNFRKVTDNKASFEVVSITDAPARNIASIDMDTVPFTGNAFNYNVPYGEGCEMRVRFFNDFLIIDYPEKYCTGVFGMNATVEGIYLKVK